MEDFFIQIVESERQNDILEELKKESLPLVIWGNGSMSYSVRKILRHYEIEPVACWVDHARYHRSGWDASNVNRRNSKKIRGGKYCFWTF